MSASPSPSIFGWFDHPDQTSPTYDPGRAARSVKQQMTPTQFRQAIGRLGISQVQAAKLFGLRDRAVRNWVAGKNKVPHAVAVLLQLLVAGKIEITDIKPPGSGL